MIKSFGTDSEFFLFDKLGEFVPAYHVTSGTKEKHEVIMEDSEYGTVAVHWDNVALEITVDPIMLDDVIVSDIENEITQYLEFVNKSVSDWVKKKGLVLSYDPIISLPKMVELDDEANIFGCEPDYNVYLNGEENESPSPVKAKGFRTAGAHFHFGMYITDSDVRDNLIMHLDRNMWEFERSLFSTEEINKSKKRRSLYGSAGSYRDKPYGFEYRVSSPLAYKQPPRLANMIAYAIHKASLGEHVSPIDNIFYAKELNGLSTLQTKPTGIEIFDELEVTLHA